MRGSTHKSKKTTLASLFSKIFFSGQQNVSNTSKISSPASNGGDHTSSPHPDTGGNIGLGNTGTSLLPNAHDFVMNNPTFNVQGDRRDVVASGMKALSKRVIDGAEYDSSARDPPPQCHPGTRIELIGRINKWFQNEGRQRAFLWLNGPAGVGKSAVFQTFAESLADSKSLGATLFFSRLNDRRNPKFVFTTVAHQLATRVPAYRTYITERLALDRSLLKKGMKEQFKIFITEPFGENEIGRGEGPWAVLLDGLDECEGVDEQCKIVQLVSEFVLSFPHAPLIWTVSSRPEPHIVATFADEAVALSHWSEYIPINSTEACQDVERYLNVSFKAMRKRFSHIPSNWPSETQFLKLSSGALGLFIFARTAVRFMEDPNHADPVSRLNLLLSVIDHLDVEVTDDHPFSLLDALYAQILTSIPPSVWRTTKRILGLIICTLSSNTKDGLSYPLRSRTVLGASTILGLELSVAYGSLHKLHSVLEVPNPKRAHKSRLSFLHASFGDYLTDPTRAKDFWVDRGESVDDITRSLFRLYLDKPWDTSWTRYTHQLSRIKGSSFYTQLKEDAERSQYYAVTGVLRSCRGSGPFKSQLDRSECLEALNRINLAEVCKFDGLGGKIIEFLIELWVIFREELASSGLFKDVFLRNLQIDHLDFRRNRPTCVSSTITFSPNSPHALQGFLADLRSLQQALPEQPILVCGSTPETRNALMHGFLSGEYYCIPYPY